MSSCFLCDTSYRFTNDDKYSVVYAEDRSEYHYMKYMPIMVGSSGLEIDRLGHIVDLGADQQHKDNNKQNYISYRVKRIEFRASFGDGNIDTGIYKVPNYIVIFKVPFREPVFDYYFTLMKNFILFSEPECVLKYGIYTSLVHYGTGGDYTSVQYVGDNRFSLTVNKPFIVGPNDYVGVLYFFVTRVRIESSAKVWFDVV